MHRLKPIESAVPCHVGSDRCTAITLAARLGHYTNPVRCRWVLTRIVFMLLHLYIDSHDPTGLVFTGIMCYSHIKQLIAVNVTSWSICAQTNNILIPAYGSLSLSEKTT